MAVMLGASSKEGYQDSGESGNNVDILRLQKRQPREDVVWVLYHLKDKYLKYLKGCHIEEEAWPEPMG